jgi:hypothetical protein
MAEEPKTIGDNRQPDGKFGPGNIANPEGRPKGTFSLIAMLRSKLQEVEPKNQRTYAELLIERIAKSAISDGNDQQIKNILQYLEGMPNQKMTIEGDGLFAAAKLEIELIQPKETIDGDDAPQIEPETEPRTPITE